MSVTAEAATKAPAPHAPGHEIAPGYHVIEHSRRGSDYDTYDAWSRDRYCRCFVKTPRPDRIDDSDTLRRLRLEAKLLLSLRHPHLVRGYEFIRPDAGQPAALVMETLSGATLSYLLGDGQRLAARDLAYLGQHLCSAVRYLHDQGYLHLDIKPGNIIANEGRARIIDLSLARRPGQHHSGIGTPTAMAPEQARGGRLGPAADAWGIGLVLHQAATGTNPFDTPDAQDEESKSDWKDDPSSYPQLTIQAPSVRTSRRLPRPLANAIDQCLRANPDQRPRLRELTEAMTAITGDADPTSGLPSGQDEGAMEFGDHASR